MLHSVPTNLIHATDSSCVFELHVLVLEVVVCCFIFLDCNILLIVLMEAIPLCDIIQSYTNIYVNTQLFLFYCNFILCLATCFS